MTVEVHSPANDVPRAKALPVAVVDDPIERAAITAEPSTSLVAACELLDSLPARLEQEHFVAFESQIEVARQDEVARRSSHAAIVDRSAVLRADLRRALLEPARAHEVDKLLREFRKLHGCAGPGLVLGVRPIDGDEIFAPLEPTRWLCRELQWVVGRPPMFIGSGGSGKTLAAQSAAVSLMSGRPIWGQFSHAGPVNVIHVDREIGQVSARRRYQRLALGLGLTDVERAEVRARLRLLSFPRINLTSPNAREEYLRAFDGRQFAILDALRGETRGVDENDAQVRDFLDLLPELSEQTGCVPLLLHHTGKLNGKDPDNQGRGSSGIRDASGATLLLEQKNGEPRAFIRMTRESDQGEGARLESHYLEYADVPIGINPRAGVSVDYRTIEQVEGHGARATRRPDKLETAWRKVLEYIESETKQGRGVPGKDAASAGAGVGEKMGGVAVQRLLDLGQIEDRPEQVKRGYRPRYYATPVEAPDALE